MNSTAPATSVILFARKPSDVNTTIVLQWFLSQLFQEIKLGTIKNGEWVVIRISNASRSDELLLPKVKKPKKAPTILSSSSASINSNKDTSTPTNNDIFSIDSTTTTKSVSTQNESKTNQQINTIIVPNTEILFTFASFSISLVIELFLSSTYVSGSPTIGTKIKHEFSLIIHEICKSLRNQYYVSRVYISVMGFCAEYNLSYLLFRGELSHSTDPDLFLHSLHLRMLAAEKEIREFTRQTTNTKSFPSFHGFLKSAVKGHELLPPETFTKSIIILSDTVDVDTQKCQTYLENRSIPFYVCSVHGSRQAVPILNSFAHSKYELCALVESSRGRYIERQSISTTNNTTSTATSAAGKLDNFIGADFFTYSFLTETPRNRHTLAWQLRNHASVLALNDTPLQSYVLSDSTVEHIIASRLAEGFRITTIKFSDSTSNQYMSHSSIHSSNNIDSISMSRQPTGRQTSRVSSQEKTIIIRFQKLVSGLSLLLYETSFRWGKLASNQATNTARQNLSHNNSFALFRERSSPRVTSGDSASSRLTWLSGSISVDIKCSAVPSTVASVSRSLNTSITLAKRISEVDNSVVSLLGLPFFPGCQTESSTPSSRDPRKSHLRNLERNISTFDRLTLQDCHHKQYYYIYKPAQQLGTQGAGTGLGLGVGMNTSTPTTDTTTIPKLSKDQSLFVKESNRNILLNNLKESFPLFGIELQLVLDGSKILIILSNVNSVIQFCYLLHVYENCNCFLTVSLQYLNVYSDDSQSFMTSKLFQTIETTLLHLSIQHVRIRCDLTPSAILQHQEINLPIFHKNDYSLVLNQLQSRHILISDKSKESLPLQFLLSDLIRIKESLGWQCILNLSYDTHISLIMVAVVSNCPTGQRQEALLQFHLKAQFTQEGVSLEYQYRFPHYVDLSNQITSSSYITATSTAISANKDVELVSASTLAVAHNLTDYLKLSKDLDEDTFYLYSVCFRLRHAVFTPKKVNMNEQAFKLDDWNMISRFSVGKEMKLYTFHDRESLLNYDVIRMLFVSALRNISNLSTMRVDGGSTGESFDVLVWAQGSSLILMKFPNICEEEEVYVSTNTSTNDNNNNGNNGNYESTDARFFDEDETEAALATEKKVYFRVSVRLIELPCSKLNPDFPLFKKTNVSMLSTKQVRDETHFKWQKTFELQRRSQGSVEHSFAKMKSAIEELHEICILERLIVGLKSISVGNSVGTSNNHLPTIDTTNIPNKADRSLNQNVPDTAIQERDIEYILRRCVSSEYEVDISAMFRRIASSLEGRGGMNRKPAVFNMLYGAFMTTVSKQITDTLGGLIFSDLMSSTKDFSVDLFGALSYETLISQLSNHQFIRFSLMYRSDENVPFKTSSLPSTSRGLIDTLITLAVQLLTSSRLNRSSFEVVLQLNVMSMRLPTYPSSSWIICNDGSSNQNCTTTTTPTYTTSCSLFLSNVCKSVRQFVAAESLLHFLQSSQALVADDLILVQQSLTEHDDVLTHEFNLEFFVPVSKYVRGQVAPPQTDSVIVSLLASQLKILQPSCNQKSDVIYLRQWQIVEPILPLDSIPTEHSTSPPSDQPITAVNSTTTTNTIPTNNTAIKTIPLWILMTLVSNTSDPTDTFSVAITHNNLSSTSQPTMSMKLSVSLKILGNDLESSFSQEYMLTQCIDTLQKGWVRVNQAILLQNLLETQSSSPLLIAPPIKPAILTPTTSTASLTTTSDLAVASQTNPRAPKSRPPIPTLSTLVRKPITPTTPASTSATPVPVGSKVNKIGSIEKIPPRMSKALNDGSAETLTDGIASIDSKENNETETTKTSNTLQTDNASLPFKLNTNKLIEPGCFACQKQGEVVCNVYSCVTLNQESIVRSLEAVALSQIAVQNNERYFVSRDSAGSVFYMTFDMESVKEKEGGRVVKLTLFGITAPDSQITFQLKELLFSRLIEISARSVSTNLRSSALTSNTLSFLKTASPSKHVHSVIKLPSYVHDHYLFCLIARQLLLQSPLLAAVKLPSTQKVYSYSEYIHPAFLGYKVARPASNGDRKMSVDDGDDYDENEDEGNDDISSSMSQLGGPMLKLVRNTHVSSYDDSKKPHPIFAEISKEENGPAKYTFTHGVSAIWQQNEFSFIYNTLPIGPVQGGRQPTSTQATKVPSASQGLALVQLSLAYSGSSPSKSYQYMTSSESPTLVTTGGFLQVCDDVRVLNDQLLSPTSTEDISLNADQAGRQNIGMGRASLGNSIDTSVSIPLTNDNSSSNSSQGLQVLDGELELHLHILPTLPMQIQYLHDAINNCLEQALVWYVFERVLATSNNDTQLGNNSWMETSIDLFQRAFHRIRKPVVSIPSSLIPIFSNTAFASTTTSTTSHLWDKFTISCILSKENIHELLENLRTSFEEISPTLASTAALFKRTGKGTSTHEVDSDDLVDCIVASRFHSDDTSNSSISSSSQNTIDGKGIQTQSTTTSFTVVPDYDSSTTGSLPLPRNVKCRHYFLVGSMEGTVFSMYSFNINTSTLVKIKESTQEIIQRLIQRGRAYAVTSITNLTTNLRKTVRSTTISAITSQPTVIDTISVITNKLMPLFVFGDFVLGQLSYQHRKLSNIMKMKESKMTEINPEILNWFDRLPASVWRRGESLVSTTMQSPCTKLSDTSSGVLEQQFRRLIDEIYHMFIKEERCEVLKIISNDEPTTAFLLFPQPKRSSILLLDIHHYNTGMLVITPRCIDIAELLIASIVSYPHPEFAFSDTIESAYLQWVQQSIQRDSHFSVYDILKVSYKSIEKSLLLKQRLDRINSIFVPHCFLWYGNSFVPPPSLSLVPNVFNIREIQNKLQSWSEIATNTSTYYTDIYHNLDNSSIIQYKKFGRLLNISDLNLKEIFVPLKSEIPVSTDVNDVSKVSSLFIVPFHVYPHHQVALIDPSIIGYALVEVTEITVQQSETTDLNTQKDLNSDVSIIKVDSSSISVSISLFAMNASCCMMKKEKSIDHRLTDSKPPTIVAMSLEPTIDRVKENKKEVEVEITEILDEAKISPEIEGLSPTILYYSSSSPVIIDDTEEYYDAMNVPQVICNNIFRLVLAWRRSTA